MGDLSTTNTFVSGTTAVASEVNTNFSDIVNYVNARNAGSSKWDALKTSGNASVDGTLTITGAASFASTLSVGSTDVVAAVASLTDGWVEAGETWTYASSTTFTITGDKTGKYSVGDKIKLTQTTAKYFYVMGITYGAPNTTITIYAGNDYTLANAAVTSPYYSKYTTPNGFPSRFNITSTITGFSSTNDNICSFTLNGKMIFVNYEINGTSNATSFFITLPSTIVFDTSIDTRCPIASAMDNGNWLSTGNPTASNDSSFTSRLTFGRDRFDSGWTSSGQKLAIGIFNGYIL